MKTIFTLSHFAIIILITSFFSCAGDPNYDEGEDVVILRDTVVMKVDSSVREKRDITKLKLNLVIQLGAFRMKNHADAFASTAHDNLKANVDIKLIGDIYIVTVGYFTNGSKAEDYLIYVKARGYESAFIKNLE